MEFFSCAPMKDDVLHLVRLLYADSLKYRATKYILAVLFAFHFVMSVLQTIMFVSNHHITYVMQYAPSYLAIIIAKMCMIILYKFDRAAFKTLDSIKCWNADSGSRKVHAKILRQSRRFTFFAIAINLLGLVLAVEVIFPDEHESEIFYAYNIFKEWFPGHEKRLFVFYKPIMLVSAFPLVALGMNSAYFMLHMRFQRYLNFNLLENVEVICQSDGRRANRKIDLFYDERFQDRLRKFNIFIIERRNSLTTASHTMLDTLKVELFVTCIFVVLVGVSMPGFLITVPPGLIHDEFHKIFVAYCITISMCGFIFAAGQNLENLNENAFTSLTQLKWYNHSKNNKLILLMSLCCLRKPKRLVVYGNTALNHESGYQVIKVIYSVVSCMLTLKMKAMNRNS